MENHLVGGESCKKTDEEIAIINQVYNNEIPKMIDEYVKTVTIRRLSNVNK